MYAAGISAVWNPSDGQAERGVFIDGPELALSHPPEMPVSGEATYAGGAGGLCEYLYGSGWGELKGESQYVEFSAPIELRADFSEGTIAGCIGSVGSRPRFERGGFDIGIGRWLRCPNRAVWDSRSHAFDLVPDLPASRRPSTAS